MRDYPTITLAKKLKDNMKQPAAPNMQLSGTLLLPLNATSGHISSYIFRV